MPADYGKLNAWLAALAELAKGENQPGFRPWTVRSKALDKSTSWRRFEWIRWVEERAKEGHPAWCKELVVKVMTTKLRT